jgi:hypothetical protein
MLSFLYITERKLILIDLPVRKLFKNVCVYLPQCKTDNSHRAAKAGDIYMLQIAAWPWDTHTSATQPALIAETRMITG